MSGAEAAAPPRPAVQDDPRRGALWLLADMGLVVAMMVVVKAAGGTYPAIQLVFLRSLVGLALVLPLAWRRRRALLATRRLGGHLGRVACNTLALTGNFVAVTALPLAFVTAAGFTRPLVLLALAALLLGERVSRIRWIGTGVGFAGVLIMVRPDAVSWNVGLAGLAASIVFGALAVIQTRRLREEDTVVLMVFYTAGLSLLTALPAFLAWHPVAAADWPALLAIGVLAQLGQYCFLRAHRLAPTRFLAPLGYLSILLSTAAGYFAFGEVPRWQTLAGAAVIVVATRLVSRLDRAG